MKSRLTVLILVVALASFAILTSAQKPAAPASPKAQTACPVSGKSIDAAKSPHIDYQGQRIYFCCEHCPAKFKADPEKYFDKLAKDGVVLENVQTACPVSGEKLENKDNFVDYKGRRVYFCCPKCPAEFKKDPAKYLAKLPGEQPKA